jgi:hypothetical protein
MYLANVHETFVGASSVCVRPAMTAPSMALAAKVERLAANGDTGRAVIFEVSRQVNHDRPSGAAISSSRGHN